MARCIRCGRENAAGALACLACGAALSASPPVLSPSVPRPPVPSQPPLIRPLPSSVSRPAAIPTAGGLAPLSPSAAPAQLRCPACGVAVPAGFKFCGACGTPIATAATPRPGVSPLAAPPAVQRRLAVRAKVMILGPDGAVLGVSPLTQEETSIGAAGEVRIADPFAAPLQGRFVFRGPLLSYLPERTPNGSFLLIKRETELRAGFELRVGRQLLRLEPFPLRAPTGDGAWGSPNPGYRFRMQQLLAGGIEGDSFPLRDGDNLVGRTAGDLSFPGDGYVSSRHAVISVRGEQVTIKDIGSSNGTFVRLEAETNIDPGDLLIVGEQLLRVDPP